MMKSGCNYLDENKIRKYIKDGVIPITGNNGEIVMHDTTPELVSDLLQIKLDNIKTYFKTKKKAVKKKAVKAE